jgi:8-oxo-dGTP diphosphatase
VSGPALTADVVLLAGEPAGSVLLIERGNEPFKGSWALPGGFVESDERVHDAALRELSEETGISLDADLSLLGVYDTPGRDPRGPTVSVTYVHRCAIELPATGGDDAARARWFALDSLPPLAFDHEVIVAAAAQWSADLAERRAG